MFRSILSLKTERVISWYMIYELSGHLCAKRWSFFCANKTLKKMVRRFVLVLAVYGYTLGKKQKLLFVTTLLGVDYEKYPHSDDSSSISR